MSPTMSPLFIVLTIVFAVVCFGVVGAILLQKKRDAGGVGSIAGMGNVAERYADHNKGRTMEGRLERWTKVGAVFLGVLAFVLCLV